MLATQTQDDPVARVGERRGSDRMPAVPGLARLCWQGRRGPRVGTAVLRNVGRGGALAVTSQPPPVGATVSIRLLGPVPSDWVEATVLDVRRGDYQAIQSTPDVRTIRLAFHRACPGAFLAAAAVPEVDDLPPTDEFLLISAP